MYTETIRYKLRVTERDKPPYDIPATGLFVTTQQARNTVANNELRRKYHTRRPLYELVTITTREEVTETL